MAVDTHDNDTVDEKFREASNIARQDYIKRSTWKKKNTKKHIQVSLIKSSKRRRRRYHLNISEIG